MQRLLEVFAVVIIVLAMFIASLFGDADAQIIPSIPYTLTNGSLADATQVIANFNAIVTDTNANAATSGANTNITSLTGLTTPLANTYGGTVIYTGGTTGGSANAQTLVTTVPSNFAQTAGNIVTAIAGFSNSGSMNLAVNALPLQSVYKQSPSGEVLLTGGEVVAGSPYLFLASTGGFDLINPTVSANSIPLTALALTSNNTFLGNISGGNASPSALGLASTQQALNAVITVKSQKITSTGTYTPCAGLIYGVYQIWGGGGGGGGVTTTGNLAGGGGGAGGYSAIIASSATVGASQTVTIGGGGAAGTSGGGTGGTGGTTSFGAILTAAGGVGGVGGSGSAIPLLGGVGGAGSVFGVTTQGMYGFTSTNGVGSFSGAGGSTLLGGNGIGLPETSSSAGTAGIANSGSGGSGGQAGGGGSAETGGAGGTGLFIATEYCNQ